jgi:hypothetical protein
MSTVTGAGQSIGTVADVGSDCVTKTNEVAWQSLSVSSREGGTGVKYPPQHGGTRHLRKGQAIGLLLPRFEPCLKSCQPVPLCAIHGERLMNAMPEGRPRSRKTELAPAIAGGTSVTACARGRDGTGALLLPMLPATRRLPRRPHGHNETRAEPASRLARSRPTFHHSSVTLV